MDLDIVNLRPLRVIPKTIEAACYNQVRLALLRLGNPLRVPLPEHRGLEIILENHYWLCVDSALEDQPIMAWLDFDTRRHNQALYEPVSCELRLYHTHAGLIMGSALDAMEQSLSLRLAGTTWR